MTSKLIATAFRFPVLMALIAAMAGALGAVAYTGLSRDIFPDLSTPVFSVIVQNSTMAPEELEYGVSLPIETALSGVPGVRRVRSRIVTGVAQVTAEFEPEWDYYLARQLVGERLAEISTRFPPGTQAPLVSGVTVRLNEVLELTLSAEPGRMDLMALRDLAEFPIKNRLLGVPGVARVERIGGFLRQFQIQVDPHRLRSRGVPLGDVLRAAKEASENAAGSLVVQGETEWTVRALGRAREVSTLRKTVVSLRGLVPITLGDVAEVREAPALRRGLAHSERGEVVSLRVIKQFGVDTVRLARAVGRAVAEIRLGLPRGIHLDVSYDQGEVVERALGSVTLAVAIGAGAVVLVLLLLLGSARAAVLVAVTIPLSVLCAGLILKAFNVGLNTMTLGGIAIAVGLLVDAAIIMVENVAHRLHERSTAPGVVLSAAQEVGRPILYAVAVVVAVFLPLALLRGLEGQLYRPLALAVMAAMLAALVLTLTIVPPVAGRLLRGTTGARDVWLMRWIKRWYAPALAYAMRHAGWVRIGTLAITVPAVVLALQLGTTFVPEIDEGALMIQTLAPAQASLAFVDRVNHRVEDVLRNTPEVKSVVRRTGRSEQTADPMPHTLSDILVVLRSGARAKAVAAKLRHRLEKVRALRVLFTTPIGMRIDEGLGGTPADLVVRIYGTDLGQLRKLAHRAEAITRSTPGVGDVRPEPGGDAQQIQVRVRRESAARYGVRPGEIADLVRIGLAGEKVGDIWRGQNRYDLVVRLGRAGRVNAARLRSLYVDTPRGGHVMLREVASVKATSGLASLRRERMSRRVGIEGRVTGGDLGGVARDLKSRLQAGLELPPGYFVEVGGRIEAKQRAERWLLISIAAALALVMALLYLALGGWSEVFVIFLTLPDAFVGGILALWLAGESWNVSSLVGLIGLFGIAVQNGLVLISQTREGVARGAAFEDALQEASIGRVRPKILTALTAICGLLPLLLLPGGGTEIERPLALVMVGGLVTSTLFTLLALPTFYELVHRWRGRRADWKGDS